MAKAAKAKSSKTMPMKPRSVKKNELHLAEARLWTNRNRIEGSFPLFVRAALERFYIEGKERSYVAHIRSATFALKFKNLEDDPSKGTFSKLSAKGIETHTVSKTENSKRTLGAKLKAVAHGFSAEAGATVDTKFENKTTTKAEMKIPVVSYASNGKWTLGHPEHGDPDKGGFLEGNYFSEEKPACHIRLIEGKKSAQIDAVISIRRSDMHVVPEGGYRDDKEISQSDEPDAVGALLEKLKELRLMKDVIPTGSFVIAKECMIIEPAEDE